MARLWVGGATGFLGSHLVRALGRAGHDVVLTARSGGHVDGTPVQCVDVLDEDAVAESARGCDGAFLVAGKVSRDRSDAEALHRLHVLGTRHALRGLRRAGVRRVVYASTSGVIAVGTDPALAYDESAPVPMEIIQRFPYYRSKYYAELEALEANEPPSLEVIVVNPTLLLGPGDSRNSSTDDVRRFLERTIPAVPGGGLSFIDVRDAAEATLTAFERGRAGERYLLSAVNMTLAAFFSRLERISGVPAPRLSMPRSPMLAAAGARLFSRAVKAIGGESPVDEVSVEMSQYFWYCDPTKAERELGLAPRDPAETLRDTVEDILRRDPTLADRVGHLGYALGAR